MLACLKMSECVSNTMFEETGPIRRERDCDVRVALLDLRVVTFGIRDDGEEQDLLMTHEEARRPTRQVRLLVPFPSDSRNGPALLLTFPKR